MSENIHERYGPYPKKKEKKRGPTREGRLFTKAYEWLRWKIETIGELSFRRPCLEH